MTMILIMLTLFIGGLAAWMIEGWNRDLPRWISIASITLAALLLRTAIGCACRDAIAGSWGQRSLAGIHQRALDSTFWHQLCICH